MKLFLRSKAQLRRGISLIECLTYIAVLAVLMSIGGATVGKAWSRSRALSRNAQDIQRAINVGERWRADIRAATGHIETIATPTNQILRIPSHADTVEYEFADGEVRRRTNAHAGWMTVLLKVNASQMLPGTEPGVTSWQWELELQPAQKKTHVRPLFTFSAVPGKGSTR
jgi:Tfp pilus assembly protein PilE